MAELDGDKVKCVVCGVEGVGLGFIHDCVSYEAKAIAVWLRSADAGALYGSTTWSVRQQIARGLEGGLHKTWRSRVDDR